jgi:Leucine-rich repeat (LRR) protein
MFPLWFSNLTALHTFSATNNQITAIQEGTFVANPALAQLFLYENRIREVTNAAFGTSARSLHTVYLNNNLINNIDPFWLDAAENLEYLTLANNLCTNRDFFNVGDIRWRLFEELLQCIDNFMMDPWINCEYSERVSNDYACTLHTHNPNGRNDLAAIEGDHVAGRTNEDVTILTSLNQNTRIIPSIVCESFPNLRTILVMNSNLEDLSEESFAACAHIEIIYLHGNRINGIPDFTFRNNPNLIQLDVGLNWIESLNENSFTGSGLTDIDIDSNRFTEFNQNWFTSVNSTLRTIDAFGNSIGSLGEDAFS